MLVSAGGGRASRSRGTRGSGSISSKGRLSACHGVGSPRMTRDTQMSVANSRCRSVWTNDHSPSTLSCSSSGGRARARSTVSAHNRSTVSQAAPKPATSIARMVARNGSRRSSSASTSGPTSTPLTVRPWIRPSISTSPIHAPRTRTRHNSAPSTRRFVSRTSDEIAPSTRSPCWSGAHRDILARRVRTLRICGPVVSGNSRYSDYCRSQGCQGAAIHIISSWMLSGSRKTRTE